VGSWNDLQSSLKVIRNRASRRSSYDFILAVCSDDAAVLCRSVTIRIAWRRAILSISE